jgi:hypothetical protein
MKKYLWFLVAAIAGAVAWGCSGDSSSNDSAPAGSPPPVIEPEPGMKAPEDREGGKKDGSAAGAG